MSKPAKSIQPLEKSIHAVISASFILYKRKDWQVCGDRHRGIVSLHRDIVNGPKKDCKSSILRELDEITAKEAKNEAERW